VVVLAVFVLCIRSLFKSVGAQAGIAKKPAAPQPTMQSAEDVIAKAFEEAPPVPQYEAPPKSVTEAYVQEVAKISPEEVANVVKAWIQE